MTYAEALELIDSHLDYGGSLDKHALAVEMCGSPVDRVHEILACEIEASIFEEHVLPALAVARKVIK